ncbi:MAG: aminodeoxychorismate synthase component I [Acidobacteriota bacterium]
MREIKLSADELISVLLNLEDTRNVCILDSCGVNYLNSHLLIAGFDPLEILQITDKNPTETFKTLDKKLSLENSACIFTISYDFGLKLENIKPREKEFETFPEPDVFLAVFDCLIIHDYNTRKTFLTGNQNRFDEIEELLSNQTTNLNVDLMEHSKIYSNFTRENYIETITKIKEHIIRGDTYQTNLTQQFRAELPESLTPQKIFRRLRKSHPAPFSAFIKRQEDFVVSISPERFFKVQGSSISASPIKGTRPRGETKKGDLQLKNELLNSAKDHAENVMIVDLLRNDIGRICEFGSVEVEKLCDLETHPTLFHLVSTIKGELRENLKFSDIIPAVFPCGSITGAPKIRTMKIIDEIETANRGLSMGAIGYSIQNSKFKIQNSFDLSVAIRTMVIRQKEAIFNVGGGIVIDSIPEAEYEETLVKAKALMNAMGGKLET